MREHSPWLSLRIIGLAAVIACLSACSGGRVAPTFRVIRETPQYLLQSPDSLKTPFWELLDPFQDMYEGWVALSAPMKLRVEKVYFSDPDERTIANYIGTETVRYAVLHSGELQQVSLESLPISGRRGEPPVQDLIPASQRRLPNHRLFLQLMFNQGGETQHAILLSAESTAALQRLTMELIRDPVSTCRPASRPCTTFPEDSTASPDIEIVENGQPRSVPWTTRLASIVRDAHSVELHRFHDGVWTPVELDSNDPEALSLFLLPGDHIQWE